MNSNPKFLVEFPRIIFLVFVLTGCVRQEIPVTPHPVGDVLSASVNMDPSYRYQVYFSLRNDSVVGKNDKSVWDLGFETTPSGFHIVLNGAKSMFAFNTGKADFNSVTVSDSAGFGSAKKCDSYTGSFDSLALGDWRITKPVYLIDRGFNESGMHQGYVKVKFLQVDHTGYILQYSELGSSTGKTVSVKKYVAYNLSFLSLATGEQVIVEPQRSEWDIVFSQYTFLFYDVDPPTPYLVTGCLLNRNNTQAYLDTVHQFGEINFATVTPQKFSSDISVIGYNWKVYAGSVYTVNAKYSYVIRDAEGKYYKMRFTGFYSSSGLKGNPQWEYQRL